MYVIGIAYWKAAVEPGLKHDVAVMLFTNIGEIEARVGTPRWAGVQTVKLALCPAIWTTSPSPTMTALTLWPLGGLPSWKR